MISTSLFIFILAAAYALYPEESNLAINMAGLQLKKLWLLLRLYPQIQIYRFQMRFRLWRQRHNNGNRNNL